MSSLPSDLPKLPKWPFFLFDIVLLATAALIAWNNPGQLNGFPLYAVLGCVVLAAGLCVIPLLVEYMRAQDEALDERQRALEALSATVANAAEQIGISAQGLTQVSETVGKALKQAEQIPHKLQERISEIQGRLDSSRDEEMEELERELAALRSSEAERLEVVSDKVHKTVVKIETLLHKLESTHSSIEARSSKLSVALDEKIKQLEVSLEKLKQPPLPEPPPVAPVAAPVEPPAVVEEEPLPLIHEIPAEPAAVVEPKHEVTTVEPTVAEQTEPSEPSEAEGQMLPATSISSDGATRLLVTAYIGIGNRLYIRGDGPGLSREKGIPLQFVSIGKWRWESAEATEPVHIRLLKNDQTDCPGLGELSLEPGQQAEITANF